MSLIMKPFAWLLTVFYQAFHSYGLALILFAVVVKVVLFPFSLKGKKSMVKMSAIQSKATRIQKQYANNKEKQQEELQKLYTKENVNPMGGCLWSFLPIIFLFPLYAIIRQPLQYMMGVTVEQVTQIAEAIQFEMSRNAYGELILSSMLGQSSANLSAAQAIAPSVFPINFSFLGMDLAQKPVLQFWTQELNWNNIGLTLMPIVSALLSLVTSFVMQKTNKMSNPNAAEQTGANNFMLYALSPLMSLWIGYNMPAGLCVYWIINSLLSMVQEFISALLLKKDYAAAAEAARKQELLDKEEEKRRKAALSAERARRAEEKKKGGKKKDKEKASAGVDVTASRVGIRAYARGRAYDPARFGAVTEYRDPDHPVDEEAIEAARAKREKRLEEAKLEADVTAQVAAEMADLAAGSADEVEEAIEKLEEQRSQETLDEADALAATVMGEAAEEPSESEQGEEKKDEE